MGDVSVEMIQKTQKSLGKYVKKPALTDKLLKKPPFRFLHDIIKVVITENGFLKGLYSEDELNSENVKEKEAKVAFLTKLIDATKYVSKSDLKAKPTKIIAGLEPTDTNVLLQSIAKILDRKLDTQEYVTKFKTGELKTVKKSTSKDKKDPVMKKNGSKTSVDKNKENSKKEKPNEHNNQSKSRSKARDASVNRVKKTDSTETPKSSERLRESSRAKKVKNNSEKVKIDATNTRKNSQEEKEKNEVLESNKLNLETNISDVKRNNDVLKNGEIKNELGNVESSNENTNDQKTFEINGENPENSKENEKLDKPQNIRQSSAGLVRPKSARPKSGDRGHVSSRMGNHAVKDMVDGSESRQGLVEMKTTVPTMRPKSSLRPPSVRPSSARPAAPRLRPDSALPMSEPVVMGNINVIVENFDPSAGDEEETVVIQNTSELGEDDGPTANDLLDMSTENKGQLVEQILEQIQDGEGDGVKKKVDIDWEQDGLRGKDAITKEVTQLRSLIQSLTKTANPLGKLMNYLHEDLDAMHGELQMWTNTKRQLYGEIEKQKRSEPLELERRHLGYTLKKKGKDSKRNIKNTLEVEKMEIKINAETSKPLLAKLERLKAEVKKVEEEISISRSNIFKNEHKITDLLNKK